MGPADPSSALQSNIKGTKMMRLDDLGDAGKLPDVETPGILFLNCVIDGDAYERTDRSSLESCRI